MAQSRLIRFRPRVLLAALAAGLAAGGGLAAVGVASQEAEARRSLLVLPSGAGENIAAAEDDGVLETVRLQFDEDASLEELRHRLTVIQREGDEYTAELVARAPTVGEASELLDAWSWAYAARTLDPKSAFFTPPPAASDYPTTVLAGEPVSYWRFDDLAVQTGAASGQTADASGNGHDGRIAPPVSAASIVASGSSAFVGPTVDIRVPSSPALDRFESLTVEAWIALAELPPPGGVAGVVGKGRSYALGLDRVGESLEAWFSVPGERGDAPRASAPVSPALGPIQHLVGTYDGRLLRLYVNGREVASREGQGPLVRSAAPLVIGRLGRDSMMGRIDEVALYDRALAPAEVARHRIVAHYAGPTLASEREPVVAVLLALPLALLCGALGTFLLGRSESGRSSDLRRRSGTRAPARSRRTRPSARS